MASTRATIDHEEIREFVDRTGGCPARVKQTGAGEDPGILRIDYPGFSGKDTLEKISWDTFFDWFERNELAFIYQPDSLTRFNKLVSRDAVDLDSGANELLA